MDRQNSDVTVVLYTQKLAKNLYTPWSSYECQNYGHKSWQLGSARLLALWRDVFCCPCVILAEVLICAVIPTI